MALLAQRILSGLSPAQFSRTRPPATESLPDRILLGPRAGHTPSTRPAVRIYLGSERHQFRAERAFLWSVEKHRDPSRTYEIYLMRDLKGFSRGFWLTGFTNYRFAIPAFCDYQGRAIYNDADQIYLQDPAILFDHEMGEAGFLSINDRDTSVMLIDCERMAKVWNEIEVRNKSRKQLEAVARAHHLWGDLDDGWNARDKEYDPSQSKLVHFTTLHTQPWRPFPDQLVYFENPTHNLWPDLEAEANQAHFLPFSATRPSRHWQSVALYLSSKLSSKDDGAAWLEHLGPNPTAERMNTLEVTGLLEYVPDQDILWVLDRLLASCHVCKLHIKEPWRHGHGQFKRSLGFWLESLRLVEQMNPSARWQLSHRARPLGPAQQLYGGPAQKGSVVYLTHKKPGHNQQSAALATALAGRLNRPCKELLIDGSELSFVLKSLLRQAPEPNLPDDATLLVAGGWLSTRMARLYQRRYPFVRLVLSGRKAGAIPRHGAVCVQCQHFGLPPHPKRIETLVPLNLGHYPSCTEPASWQPWLEAKHKVACLLGGNTKSYTYEADDIHTLARALSQAAQRDDAKLLVVSSRRSGAHIEALKSALGDSALFYHWQASDPKNPYALALEQADELMVTGESESMIADALSQGRPFSIFYPSKPHRRLFDRFSHWVAQRATQPQYNRRGSIRPQQGLQYLCARALERNWVLPPRDLKRLHQSLYDAGFATELGETGLGAYQPPNVLEKAIDQVVHELQIETTANNKED